MSSLTCAILTYCTQVSWARCNTWSWNRSRKNDMNCCRSRRCSRTPRTRREGRDTTWTLSCTRTPSEKFIYNLLLLLSLTFVLIDLSSSLTSGGSKKGNRVNTLPPLELCISIGNNVLPEVLSYWIWMNLILIKF